MQPGIVSRQRKVQSWRSWIGSCRAWPVRKSAGRRANAKTAATYLILLTARHSSADILAGLRSGADDYVTKPFKPEELRARVRLGQRIIRLEQSLVAQKAALESTRGREAFLRNRLAALESNGQETIAQGPRRARATLVLWTH